MRKEFELRINITVSNNQMGDRLSIDESMIIYADSFIDICKIIAVFDELAKKVKEERKP